MAQYVAMSLALGAWAIRETCWLGAQCSSEAKASVERNGPQGTIAEDRPGLSENRLAVTLTLRVTCWAAGNFYISGGVGAARSPSLPKRLKTVALLESSIDARHMQKRAKSARRRRGVRSRIFLTALSLALGAWAIRETCWLGAQCSSEAKASVERNGPQGTIAEDRPAVGQAGLTNRASRHRAISHPPGPTAEDNR
jgi:hypothetical protein